MKFLISIAFLTILNSSIMALNIETSIKINATPAEVWAEFTSFSDYPTWNLFLTSVEGNVAEGEKIAINAGGMKFKPKVLIVEENKELKWIGRLVMPGIFDGEHRFQLIDNGDGTTTFVHSEHFSGLLVPLFKTKLQTDTKAGFEAMNLALKARVEAAI